MIQKTAFDLDNTSPEMNKRHIRCYTLFVSLFLLLSVPIAVIYTYVAMASLGLLYHRGELSLRSWYRAEQIVADRYRLAEDSLFRKWHPDYDKSIVVQRAERLLYIRET